MMTATTTACDFGTNQIERLLNETKLSKSSSNRLKTALGIQGTAQTAQNGSKWLQIGSGSRDLFNDDGFLAGLGRKRISCLWPKTAKWLKMPWNSRGHGSHWMDNVERPWSEKIVLLIQVLVFTEKHFWKDSLCFRCGRMRKVAEVEPLFGQDGTSDEAKPPIFFLFRIL